MKQITRPKRIIMRLSEESDARLRAAADASKRTITNVVEAGTMREVRNIEDNMLTADKARELAGIDEANECLESILLLI